MCSANVSVHSLKPFAQHCILLTCGAAAGKPACKDTGWLGILQWRRNAVAVAASSHNSAGHMFVFVSVPTCQDR